MIRYMEEVRSLGKDMFWRIDIGNWLIRLLSWRIVTLGNDLVWLLVWVGELRNGKYRCLDILIL